MFLSESFLVTFGCKVIYDIGFLLVVNYWISFRVQLTIYSTLFDHLNDPRFSLLISQLNSQTPNIKLNLPKHSELTYPNP